MLMVHWLHLSDYSASKDHCSTGSHLPGIKQYKFYSCEINYNSVNTKHILTDPELCQHRYCSSCQNIIILMTYSSIYSKSNHYMSSTFIGLLHLFCDTATDNKNFLFSPWGRQTTRSKIADACIQIFLSLSDLKIWHEKSPLISIYRTLVLNHFFLILFTASCL